MGGQIHRIVENAQDFDNLPLPRAIANQVTGPHAQTRQMVGSEIGPNVIASRTTAQFGTGFQRRQGANQMTFVYIRLPRAKPLDGRVKNAEIADFSLPCQANPPMAGCHRAPARRDFR